MKTKDQKRREAQLRAIRFSAVCGLRNLDNYRWRVKSGLVLWNRSDHKAYVKQTRSALNTLRATCTHEEFNELFRGWLMPKRYMHLTPSATPMRVYK